MMFAGKKNISLYLSVLSILQIAMSFVLSCDNSGTDPDTGNRITITVVDQHGTPLQDVSIMTVPATEQFTTNRNGSAIIPIESWGAYKILATRPNGDTLEKHVLVRVADVSVQLKFTYAPLSITVSDAKGRPMQGAEVLLSPSPLKILTNDQGIAKTDSVLVRGYELSIAHDSEIVYSSEITLSETIPNVYKITASQASLTLIVTDKDGVPYDDITAITEPSGFIARSDSNGVIIFDGIPALEYTILLNRYNTLCIRIRKDLTEGTPPPRFGHTVKHRYRYIIHKSVWQTI